MNGMRILNAQADLPGIVWRSRCNGSDQCVEVGGLPNGLKAVRDSKNKTGPALVITGAEFAAVTAGIRNGEFS